MKDLKTIIINNSTYFIKEINFDLDKFDHDGLCEEYSGKSYVVIDGYEPPRVRILSHIYDENNRNDGPFDPYNYDDECIKASLEYGDECYIEELYEIISHDNLSGEIYYDYLDDSSKDWNPNVTYGFKNGLTIHKDLIK